MTSLAGGDPALAELLALGLAHAEPRGTVDDWTALLLATADAPAGDSVARVFSEQLANVGSWTAFGKGDPPVFTQRLRLLDVLHERVGHVPRLRELVGEARQSLNAQLARWRERAADW